jgi:succinyl-diaminopimelate desuccinylase
VISSAVELASQLVKIDTVNPPGQEAIAARLIADRLTGLGAAIELHELSPGRESLIARYSGNGGKPALCLSGHLDTVPIGVAKWSRNPHCGDIEDDRLWGRGSTDMKGGIAAMVVAFERLCRRGGDQPVLLALTASEETGCQGALSIAAKMGPVGALVIGEPTNEDLAIAHKGVVWLRLKSLGRAAHGSKPELGDNAIERMIVALTATRKLDFKVDAHPMLGRPSSNIGTIAGGAATNIVPDMCEATIDIRLVPGLDVTAVMSEIKHIVGSDVEIAHILALNAVQSRADHPWIASVNADAQRICGAHPTPTSASFFTDASVLVPALGYPPTAIIGPGNPALAHQVDEWCSVSAIDRAADLYEQIGLKWNLSPKCQKQIEEVR